MTRRGSGEMAAGAYPRMRRFPLQRHRDERRADDDRDDAHGVPRHHASNGTPADHAAGGEPSARRTAGCARSIAPAAAEPKRCASYMHSLV